MKIKQLLFAALGFGVLFTACQGSGKNAGEQNQSPTLSQPNPSTEMDYESKLGGDAAKFLENVSMSNMVEIAMAKAALQHSGNAEIKNLATMIIEDHQAVRVKLDSLADAKNIVFNKEMSSDKVEEIKMLNAKTGSDFDKTYLDKTIEMHNEAIKKFEEEKDTEKSNSIRRFAADVLPGLEKHAEKAKEIKM